MTKFCNDCKNFVAKPELRSQQKHDWCTIDDEPCHIARAPVHQHYCGPEAQYYKGWIEVEE